ncbi:Chromobox protein 1, partial [Dispira simplex]
MSHITSLPQPLPSSSLSSNPSTQPDDNYGTRPPSVSASAFQKFLPATIEPTMGNFPSLLSVPHQPHQASLDSLSLIGKLQDTTLGLSGVTLPTPVPSVASSAETALLEEKVANVLGAPTLVPALITVEKEETASIGTVDEQIKEKEEVSKEVVEEEVEEEYEVEKIMDRRTRGNHAEYLIKWKGYGNEWNTWEPEDNLYCHDLLREFLRARKRPPKSTTRTSASKKNNSIQKYFSQTGSGKSTKQPIYRTSAHMEPQNAVPKSPPTVFPTPRVTQPVPAVSLVKPMTETVVSTMVAKTSSSCVQKRSPTRSTS